MEKVTFLDILKKAGKKAQVFPLTRAVKTIKADRVKKYKSKPDKLLPGEITFVHYLGKDTREFDKYVWAVVKVERETWEEITQEKEEVN